MSRQLLLVFPALLAAVAGCAHAANVRAPDGDAKSSSCSDQEPCVEKAAAEPAREEPITCSAAHAHVGSFAEYWGDREISAKRRADLPKQADFVSVCRALDERIQRCLHEQYRTSHEKSCEAIFRRLHGREKTRIDSLFLE